MAERYKILHEGNIASNSTIAAKTSFVTKNDTGDPTGSEGLFCINTFDNTFKVYAEGAWRTLASW